MLKNIPGPVRETVSENLNAQLKDFSFTGGGCINHGGKLVTSAGSFFLKWNDSKKFPGMLEAEKKGLRLLDKPALIHIPKVIFTGEAGSWQLMLLEFIESRAEKNDYWTVFGERLALLHRQSSAVFGLDHNNYIGSLPQYNEPHSDWIVFFIEKRLGVQLSMALSAGKVDPEIARKFEKLYRKLPDMLAIEAPSLLHGDLWSGNLITGSEGNPCLIDPAVYYGNREAELAFTTLFGGFSREFYGSYVENFPMMSGYQERFDIYNLYPLLVHLNLFGISYRAQVVSILDKFV